MTPDERQVTIGEVKEILDYIRTNLDFDCHTAEWAIEEVEKFLKI